MIITCVGLFIGMFTVNVNSLPVDIKETIKGTEYHYHVASNYYSEIKNWAVIKKDGRTLTVGIRCE